LILVLTVFIFIFIFFYQFVMDKMVAELQFVTASLRCSAIGAQPLWGFHNPTRTNPIHHHEILTTVPMTLSAPEINSIMT
jgi:hypothetical protein